MKTLSTLISLLLLALLSYGQDITGQWHGVLKVQGTQLRLVFNVTKNDDGFSSTLDSPDQGAKGIPVTSTTFAENRVNFVMANIGAAYEGELKGEEIVGTFTQAGQSFPMDLSKKSSAKIRKPQEPLEPYPYYAEEVVFENEDAGITLAGTLTLPNQQGKYPAVVLISGSGPQDRNETLMGHKPFLILADHLTRQGIGVLRFDDRGTAQSTGDHSTATSADLATDVSSAVAYLKSRSEVDFEKIGLVGHSEGGIIAPMVAAQGDDIAYLVLLAGTGLTGAEILSKQQRLIMEAANTEAGQMQERLALNQDLINIVIREEASDVKPALIGYLKDYVAAQPQTVPEGMDADAFISMTANSLGTPWMKYFLQYDPVPTLEKVSCAVLAINGEKDLQVPAEPNLSAIKAALERGGNENVTVKELPGLNHLFQTSETGSPSEYAIIDETFSPTALSLISNWISEQVN